LDAEVGRPGRGKDQMERVYFVQRGTSLRAGAVSGSFLMLRCITG
jgi:hypothetical protein